MISVVSAEGDAIMDDSARMLWRARAGFTRLHMERYGFTVYSSSFHLDLQVVQGDGELLVVHA